MGEISLRKTLDDYKAVHMPYRNFSDRTRVEYQNDLESLITFLERSGIQSVGEISLANIETYVADLEQKGYTSLTRKRKVVAIRSFLSFLYQDGYIAANIAKKVIPPFTETSTPQFLTQAECERLRSQTLNDPRALAIIELILQTGMTLSELTRLTLSDLELSTENGEPPKLTGSIRVLGSRGKKDRIIPLNTKACTAIKNYLDARNNPGNESLFINRFGNALGERGVQKIVRKYLKKSGLERASVSTLRHTFGVHHAIHGTSAETIHEVMGHKDSRSTSIYFALAQKLMGKELENNAI